jgi:uncharacterized glyoxalase superfamily protein PhnB
MPELPDVIPMVSYENCAAAADWLADAFGFEEVERYEEDGEVTHVTMNASRGTVFLGKPGATYVSPKRLQSACETAAKMYDVPWVVDGVYVAVDDLDAHRQHAETAGARVLSASEEPFRVYRVEDLEGHRWMFSQRAG